MSKPVYIARFLKDYDLIDWMLSIGFDAWNGKFYSNKPQNAANADSGLAPTRSTV
jgi:hypothetical protein